MFNLKSYKIDKITHRILHVVQDVLYYFLKLSLGKIML